MLRTREGFGCCENPFGRVFCLSLRSRCGEAHVAAHVVSALRRSRCRRKPEAGWYRESFSIRPVHVGTDFIFCRRALRCGAAVPARAPGCHAYRSICCRAAVIRSRVARSVCRCVTVLQCRDGAFRTRCAAVSAVQPCRPLLEPSSPEPSSPAMRKQVNNP